MKPLLIIGFFSLMSFGLGCSSTSLVSSDQSKTFYTYETFNEKLKGDHLEVLLRDSSKSLIKELLAGPDSVTWYNIEKSEWQTVATADVCRVEYVNHWRGALDGFLITAGATLGAALATGGLGAAYVFGYGIIGTPIVAAIGALTGHTSKYEFAPDSTESVKGQEKK